MQNDTNTYTITIYSSRLFFPIWFAVHTHVVIECNDVATRYDIFGRTLYPNKHSLEGYLYKDVLPADMGLFIIWAKNALIGFGPRWKTRKCGSFSGGENSTAHKIYKFFIDETVKSYPYIRTYKMFNGPNSNTFTQWVIDQFPESRFKLPISAWGKTYRK